VSAPSLIRAKLTSATTALVRIRMKHEMESGQRRDGPARAMPAWHIDEFTLRLNERTVLKGHFGTGVSKDPFLEFSLKGVKAGDLLKLEWVDNRGDKRSDSAPVLAA
jgi:sulfur-oxidizing protein SoxZ